MKIIHIDSYKDGGTMKIETESQTYYIDGRIRSTTKGEVYIGYPEKDNSNIADSQKELKLEILQAIELYHTLDSKFNWKPRVKESLQDIISVTLEITMDKESAENMIGAYDCNDIETAIRTHMDEINEMDGINIETKTI